MAWSDNLKAYLATAKAGNYSYSCLMTIDGKQTFAEAGPTKEKITEVEISNAVKAVASDQKYQGVTIGGTKYVFLTENNGVIAFKKGSKACLFFHGAAYACCLFAEIEPRLLMTPSLLLKDQLSAAGLS